MSGNGEAGIERAAAPQHGLICNLYRNCREAAKMIELVVQGRAKWSTGESAISD